MVILRKMICFLVLQILFVAEKTAAEDAPCAHQPRLDTSLVGELIPH